MSGPPKLRVVPSDRIARDRRSFFVAGICIGTMLGASVAALLYVVGSAL